MSSNFLEFLERPQVMGVLNVTPDSFSDGGRFHQGQSVDRGAVLARAIGMLDAGATFLDVGGESTRPGAATVSVQEELDRVIPVVELLSQETDAWISIDTSTPEVIVEASKAGVVHLINDVRALEREGALDVAVSTGLPVCLMHMQGSPDSMQNNPHYGDVVEEVRDYLLRRVRSCVDAGVDQSRILLDPGFGFGKTLAHNLELLSRLREFKALGFPLLVGMSRKSMVGQVVNKPVERRLSGSLAAATIAVLNGADIIRVHDVEETVDVVKIATAVMNAKANT